VRDIGSVRMKRRRIFALVSFAYVAFWLTVFIYWFFPYVNASMFVIMEGGLWFSNELSQFEIGAIISFVTIGALALLVAAAFVLMESLVVLAHGARFIVHKVKNRHWRNNNE
jgi:hypothetical protein